MTMPYLMNCEHAESGWCLDCVKTLWNEQQRDRERLDFLATCKKDGWPVVEHIDHKWGDGFTDIYWPISDVVQDEWEPGDPIEPSQMQKAFRMMVDEAMNESIAFGESPE